MKAPEVERLKEVLYCNIGPLSIVQPRGFDASPILIFKVGRALEMGALVKISQIQVESADKQEVIV